MCLSLFAYVSMLYSPEFLLQLLQRFIKQEHLIKQIHSYLITNGHLVYNPSLSPNFKWKATLLFNALIRAYLNVEQPLKTIFLFTDMLAHGALPNDHTFPPLIKTASSLPGLASQVGKSLHTQVIKRGISRDPFVQTSLVSLYGQLGNLSAAHHLFGEMSEPCIVACNAMLDAFCKNGDMGSAIWLFDHMRLRDVFAWTSMINGYGRNGHFAEAIQLFRKMIADEDVIKCNVRPTEATFVSILFSCANSDRGGGLHLGKQVHGFIIKNEIELTIFMGTALIDLYGKMGCLGYATSVFTRMVVKKLCTWNAMISSLAVNGKENQALDMFQQMKIWLQPNEVTFVAVLSACARAQLVELGLELFQSMLHDFGIVPRMEHYGCIVDLLGRAGLLTEATEFINAISFEPDASVWGALLGACRIHGATELANEVERSLLELQPGQGGQYVLLSTIYAGAGMWDHAAALRKTMVEVGIQKTPAYSTINSLEGSVGS